MPKHKIPTVLFNASVVLAGLKSPSGGSGKLLFWSKKHNIKGIISEVILDEVLRNSDKIGMSKKDVDSKIQRVFIIHPEPKQKEVKQFNNMVVDFGDAHVLASAKEAKVKFLVTLDQKHLLILQSKVRGFKIVTPGQLIELLKV